MKTAFVKPNNLNGAELVAELTAAGVELQIENGHPKWVEIDADNVLWIDIKTADKAKAAAVVAAHNGTTVAPEPTIAEKLASVGLRVDDFKSALGL